MSINLLGRLNFPDLPRYLIKASNFETGQQYVENLVKEALAQMRSPGILYGGVVTPVSGLTVSISKCLILFPSGQIATADAQQVTLSAADLTNPRKDRLEIAYSLASNSSVLNIDGVSVTLDKLHTATAVAHTGVAGASPSAPALTSGSVSLGVVTLAANQTVLTAANIDQSEQSTDYGRPLLDQQFSLSILNNQASAVAAPGLALDATKTRMARVKALVYRKDDSVGELSAMFTLVAIYYPVLATWKLFPSYDGDDTGVDFSISAGGQINYASTNMTGTNYAGTASYKTEFLT